MLKRKSQIKSRFIFIVLLMFLSGCSRQKDAQNQKYSESKVLMGTFIHLDVCTNQNGADNFEAAFEQVWKRLQDINERMNVYNEKSEVSVVNAFQSQPVQVKDDTYKVIERSKYFSQKSHGAFDITVWPLIELWQKGSEQDAFPSEQQLEAALSRVGFKNIELLDDHRVRLNHAGTKIDLGGIAKGYAIDEAARIFRDYGITNFFIDAGGDVYGGGKNCLGEPWRIGIRDPRDQSKIVDIVEIVNMAVTTSGNYERYIIIQNEQWSHIINPVTGYPQRDVVSATVIGPRAMDADALATAVSVLGNPEGLELINTFPGYQCLMLVKIGAHRIRKYSSKGYQSIRHCPASKCFDIEEALKQ